MFDINYTAKPEALAQQLKGATVRYLANASTVTKNGVRVFKIEHVERVGYAEKTKKRFVTVKCRDIDDGGESKFRNLQLAGIDLVV
jgi:hypothetical protein